MPMLSEQDNPREQCDKQGNEKPDPYFSIRFVPLIGDLV